METKIPKNVYKSQLISNRKLATCALYNENICDIVLFSTTRR